MTSVCTNVCLWCQRTLDLQSMSMMSRQPRHKRAVNTTSLCDVHGLDTYDPPSQLVQKSGLVNNPPVLQLKLFVPLTRWPSGHVKAHVWQLPGAPKVPAGHSGAAVLVNGGVVTVVTVWAVLGCSSSAKTDKTTSVRDRECTVRCRMSTTQWAGPPSFDTPSMLLATQRVRRRRCRHHVGSAMHACMQRDLVYLPADKTGKQHRNTIMGVPIGGFSKLVTLVSMYPCVCAPGVCAENPRGRKKQADHVTADRMVCVQSPSITGSH